MTKDLVTIERSTLVRVLSDHLDNEIFRLEDMEYDNKRSYLVAYDADDLSKQQAVIDDLQKLYEQYAEEVPS